MYNFGLCGHVYEKRCKITKKNSAMIINQISATIPTEILQYLNDN